jgi:hypothetical protein
MKTAYPIRDWGDGYVSLKHRAEDVRGRVDFVPAGLPVSAEHWESWPRTTGNDVLAVAAFLDPHLQRVERWRSNSAGIAHRWRECLGDLQRWALACPDEEYLDNRRFWTCVLSVCVYLSSEMAPLPAPKEWEAVRGVFDKARRNGLPKDVPFGPFEGITSYDDLFISQVRTLKNLRGEDPSTIPGLLKAIPRTTNTDVKQLGAFWSKQLRDVKHIIGHDAVAERWATVMVDVNSLTKNANPNAVYPKNEAFWRGLGAVRTQVHVADGAPSTGARILDSLGYGVSQLPTTLSESAKAVAGGAAGLLRGVFSGLATPLLVGAGLVGGVLLFRSTRSA